MVAELSKDLKLMKSKVSLLSLYLEDIYYTMCKCNRSMSAFY